jgi:hypothetical protein
MPKGVYGKEFPVEIKASMEAGMKIAFSEGLLPYFLSRPTLMDTTFATRAEGLFSCYVDRRGIMSMSSFRPNDKQDPEKTLQQLWDNGYWAASPGGAACSDCPSASKCHAPDIHHYLACAYATHNRGS